MEEGYNGSILFGRWYLLARSPFPFINVDPTDKAFAIIQITNPEKTLWYSYDDSWQSVTVYEFIRDEERRPNT